MRLWAACLGITGTACGILASFQTSRPSYILITGDFAGSLEPCGCTLPTTGGIQRQAAYVRELRSSADVMLLANGATVAGTGKQDAMKAEALAEIYGTMSVDAANIATEDAKLGIGEAIAMQNLSSGRFISGSFQDAGGLAVNAEKQSGPYLIAGVSTQPEVLARQLGGSPVKVNASVKSLVDDARSQSLIPILLLDGTESDATKLAAQFPALRMIVYRSQSDPPRNLLRPGKTALVTPGWHGKSMVKLSLDGQEFRGYQVVQLTAAIKDDAAAGRVYKSYLHWVDNAGLLDHLARAPSGPFSGSAACAKCHQADYTIWEHSKHSKGLASLEAINHSRDPDCVPCHVAGLQSVGGFRSKKLTPNLANVGCESCHGAGGLHSQKPRIVRMEKVSQKACVSCHTSDQSPEFNPITYWEKIKHK